MRRGILGVIMTDIKQPDRSKPPILCEGCGSDDVKVTYTKGVAWYFKCQNCGHWDQEWLEKLDKETQ